MFNDLRTASASILIVDDMVTNIRVLSEAVRELGEVHFTTEGSEALALAREINPDIILLDIEMPGMDGYAVCQAIKADPTLCDIAIIFVTAHDTDIHELQALNLGGVDFLSRPLNVPVARARIQTQLTLRLRTKQLARAQRDLADVVQNLPAFVAYWDRALCNIFANDTNGSWFGLPAAQMRGMHMRSVLGASNYFAIEHHLRMVLDGQNPSFDLTFVRQDGGVLFGQASLVHRNQQDGVSGFLMLIADITARKEAEMALYEEKERIRITLNSIGDAVISTDTHGIITFLNPIAETMTGWLANEAIGLPIEQVMPLSEGSGGRTLQNPVRLALSERRTVGMAMNCTLRRRDGRTFDVEDSAAPIKDYAGQICGAIIVFHDVSEARALMVKMTHLANHDALTNLPNRMLLQDRCEQARQLVMRTSERMALLMLDLDHFKTINDSVGHSIGDQLIKQVASRLKHTVRPCDTISRQGGDEFVILLPELVGIDEISSIAERIQKEISAPYHMNQNRFDLSVSIGISIFPDDAEDVESLYRHADAAMYRAKQDGRNRFRFFAAEIEESLHARHLLERHMRTAVEQGNFEVFYQPKVDARNRCIVGAEALLRWRGNDGQLVSPAQFIPLAEEAGLIVPLGKFVLRQACQDAKRWHDSGYRISIAVNVSAIQFDEGTFADTVRSIIEETGITATSLELEITEGVLAKDLARTLGTIRGLKDLGVAIAIDDFGTGYSSLTYLKRFPIDILKIDQSFVRDMLTDRSDATIITAIISMANSLGLSLVAEGVEVEGQARALLEQGCDIMQGYLYARPMPIAEMQHFLSRSPRQA